MLVIVTGSEAIGRSLIAKKVTARFNNLNAVKVDGYTVDFTTSPFHVFDHTGTLVYRNGDDNVTGIETLLAERTGLATITKIQDIEHQIGTMPERSALGNEYSAPGVDLGITPEEDLNYQHILDLYYNRPYDTLVVHGVFSKYSIEKIHSLLNGDVKVINIIRNPSVAFVFDTLDPREPMSTAIPEASYWFIDSLINSVNISELPYTTTIRYEHILANSYLVFNNATVLLPEYSKFNNVISNYEKAELSKIADLTAKVDAFNAEFTDAKMHQEIHSAAFPRNLFKLLGYHPLPFNIIIQP